MSKPRVPIFPETFDNKGVLGNYPSEDRHARKDHQADEPRRHKAL